jgi:hypothetical protein
MLRVHSSIEHALKGDGSADRNERFQTILQQLLPEVRGRHTSYSDERVFETAVHLAAYRLSTRPVSHPEPDGAA